MKQGLLIILTVCVFASALVPRYRRALNRDREEPKKNNSKEICAHATPCAWSIYKPITKIIDINMTNEYCVCSPDTACQLIKDDPEATAYVYLCRVPGSETLNLS